MKKRQQTKSNVEKDGRSLIEDTFKDIAGDISKVYHKLDKLVGFILDILSKVESLEDRMTKIETSLSDHLNNPPNASHTYASITATSSSINNDSLNRFNRLEYVSSEEERKKRLLQVTIKHPQLNPTSVDLKNHVCTFLSDHLKMEPREIDANLTAVKASKDNKVIVCFSHKRFKLFLFKARKNLRSSNEVATKDLYINDNLTTYNFGLLMQLNKNALAGKPMSCQILLSSILLMEKST